jgi:uncharacterized protein YkwD
MKTTAAVAVVVVVVLGIVLTTRGPRTAPLAIVAERDGLVEVRHQVLDNTNRLRIAAGLQPLNLVPKLNRGAQDHSDWMARTRTLEHSDDLTLQMTQAYDGNWTYAGENIGVFGGELSTLLTALRQSPEHRANMLKPQYRRIGVGATWDSDNEQLWLTIWFEG